MATFLVKQVFSSDGLSETVTNHTPHPLTPYLLGGAREGPSSPGNPRRLCTSSCLQTGGLPLAAVWAVVVSSPSGEGLCGIANKVFQAIWNCMKSSGDSGRSRVSNAPD